MIKFSCIFDFSVALKLQLDNITLLALSFIDKLR